MRYKTVQKIVALALVAVATATAPSISAETGSAAHDHQHHAERSEADRQIYAGYFEDAQVKARPLSDWKGEWQSVYPYLLDGTLDPVLRHKAESGSMTAAEYRDYYDVGYRTDVERIVIDGDAVSFYRDGKRLTATYADDGHEVLTYKKGNRGVRYVFRKTGGDPDAPDFIQFSDHAIAPVEAGHFHLYSGDDRARLLEEVTNWPTYYPSSLDAGEIVDEMLAH